MGVRFVGTLLEGKVITARQGHEITYQLSESKWCIAYIPLKEKLDVLENTLNRFLCRELDKKIDAALTKAIRTYGLNK